MEKPFISRWCRRTFTPGTGLLPGGHTGCPQPPRTRRAGRSRPFRASQPALSRVPTPGSTRSMTLAGLSSGSSRRRAPAVWKMRPEASRAVNLGARFPRRTSRTRATASLSIQCRTPADQKPSPLPRPPSARRTDPGSGNRRVWIETTRWRNRGCRRGCRCDYGDSGLKVSPMSPWDASTSAAVPTARVWALGKDDSQVIIKQALDAGITTFDAETCPSTDRRGSPRGSTTVSPTATEPFIAAKVHGGSSPAPTARPVP